MAYYFLKVKVIPEETVLNLKLVEEELLKLELIVKIWMFLENCKKIVFGVIMMVQFKVLMMDLS